MDGTTEAPTVGRIVHFVNRFLEHEPAIVTHVHAPGDTVNLRAWTRDGEPESATSIAHDELCGPFTWHWPER